MKKPVYVTSPLLPSLDEFTPYLEEIWENKWLTNNGAFHQRLEQALAEYLGVPYLSLFSNGTLALLTALQALRITGEVITTPYSFVATSHTLLWNGLKPVFVDIDPVTCNLDPSKLEQAITPATSAILPVHCYGLPADVDRIQNIADIYGLKVIYDAAHAFGVKKDDVSILNHGDLSILSFHATKVFSTIEGGAIISQDEKTKKRIDYLKNFGFVDEVTVVAPGINAKMNEVQAAFGLLQLKHIDSALNQRKNIYSRYCDLLKNISGIKVLSIPDDVTWNYAYFPIFFSDTFPKKRDEVYDILRENNIYARRYFYPLISTFPMYRGLDSAKEGGLPTASHIADNVLCLPIYPDLSDESILDVVRCISDCVN
ncbi:MULTISPECIES: DegT/DnrJ/EryC1/StrS family aminotransferase [Pectobacterium]|uniref:DegT/DnrJ/EryC1/StrS family aminotransferase n=1 Tax=Pectobacterium TaxID=122277 RepID=UPI0001A426CE|nr:MULTISPECIES: DegT/DnrJ/EryC1/StrS family aminotransferase [Pectobacterium]KGA23674.1 aminotransferase [Pectobacterium brasiliense]KHS79640.1 aminotransferase [Pectobacterium brasiliense]KRF66094.1 aminotransferase [Pectobacterium brasiliense]MBN3185462.1 DegT/DnrJ/EryC1/StrS family aminotransferase [Pectobacterium brasiliense]OYN55493.1 aminotransferase [Pectobacterium carotovorum]